MGTNPDKAAGKVKAVILWFFFETLFLLLFSSNVVLLSQLRMFMIYLHHLCGYILYVMLDTNLTYLLK